MIVKSDRLAELLSEGVRDGEPDPFIISPTPDLQQLHASRAAAIDLRLGTWFTSLKQAQTPYLPLEEQPSSAQLASTRYVPFGRDYVLHPRNFVLAVTLEWLRIPERFAASVVGKSSWGRCGLVIATATGVHPGFKGCLTLELANIGEIPIQIKPGVRICQLFVHQVDGKESGGSSSKFDALRQPIFQRIELDPYALKLVRAYRDPDDK